MIFCGLLGYYSMYLLIQSADLVKKFSYQELAQVSFGTKFTLFVKLVFFLNAWRACVIYSIFVKICIFPFQFNQF